MTTVSKIVHDFWSFHFSNPHVYRRFKEYVFQLIRAGHSKYSARTIICVMRFEQDLQTSGDDEYKISNSYTPGYARMFVKQNPQYKGMFVFKHSVFDDDPGLSVFNDKDRI